MNNEVRFTHGTRIVYANRAPGEFHSIEGIFRAIAEALPEGFAAQTVAAPVRGAHLRPILRNIKWAGGLATDGLVHVTGDIHYAVLGVRRKAVVLTIHDLRFIEEAQGIKRFLFWWLWLYLPCLRANRVTVISEFTKARLLALCPVKPAKVRVIPDCVAPEFKATPKAWPSSQPRLLLVGTTGNKNLNRVAEACIGLAVQLSILGELTASQRDYLDRHGLEYDNQWDLPKKKVVAIYEACDLVVFVSTYEGFGLPILEGQAVGRPVLTSDISPMREVAGEGALKVDPFDVAAIRSGLTRLIADAELRSRLVREGFCNVERYSAKSVAAQYAEVYRELLDAR